jgi:hypothetical protein
MKMRSTSSLLLLTAFGVALDLRSVALPDSQGNGHSIPKVSLSTRQSAEVAKPASGGLREPVSTGNVRCDENWLSTRSADLISPSGVTASVELRGKMLVGKTTDDNRCKTTWILHLVGKGTSQTIIIDTRDDELYYEHIFEMDGWSKNGSLLLMSQIQTAGDWDETTPVVYDIQNQRMWRTELAPLFDKFTPKDCPVYFRTMGFASSGKIMLDVGSLDQSDPSPGEKPCFQNSLWELDYTQKRVTRVSESAAFESFGTLSGKRSSPSRE